MLTMNDIRKSQKNVGKIVMEMIKQTMKDNGLGLKDAYEKCKQDYMARYRMELPKPYMGYF